MAVTRRNGHRRHDLSPIRDMQRMRRDIEAMIEEINETSAYLVKVYQEAYVYGSSSFAGGSIVTGGLGWGRGEDKDRTSQTALDWDHRHVRQAATSASRTIVKTRSELEQARMFLEDAKRSIPRSIPRVRTAEPGSQRSPGPPSRRRSSDLLLAKNPPNLLRERLRRDVQLATARRVAGLLQAAAGRRRRAPTSGRRPIQPASCLRAAEPLAIGLAHVRHDVDDVRRVR